VTGERKPQTVNRKHFPLPFLLGYWPHSLFNRNLCRQSIESPPALITSTLVYQKKNDENF